MNGHVECLRVAHQLGGAIGISCEYAAMNGHVECLRVAHQLGGAIGISCEYAAMNGHVDCCVQLINWAVQLEFHVNMPLSMVM